MSKEHHDSAHHERVHAEHHEAKSKGDKILGFSMEAIGLIVVLVLGAAIIATWAGFAAGVSSVSVPSAPEKVLDKAVLKASVEKYFADNAALVFGSASVKLTVTDVNESNVVGGLYAVSFEISDGSQSQKGAFFSDGKNVVIPQMLFDLSKPLPVPKAPVEVEVKPIKKDKAVAELYIFSYCPAGTATLDSFAKAADLLKSVADVKVKFFSDMHGGHELQQNKIQECIQVVDNAKYWAYAQQFVEKVYPVCGASRSVDCDKTESTKVMASLGIDSNAVFACVAAKGNELYASDTASAIALQLQYSPSVVINGVYNGNADRSPAGLKKLICDGFNTPPADCAKELSATGAAATGSCS